MQSTSQRLFTSLILRKRVLLAAIGMGLLWRIVRYAMNFPLWGDEAFVANNYFHRGFAGLCRPLDHGQIAPILFMWLELLAARFLGCAEWVLRLIPLMAGLASVPLFAWLAWRVLGRFPGILATALFAISYFPVRYSAEVKPYELDLFIALGLLALGWRVEKAPGSTLRWAMLIVASAAAVWASYPSVFISGGIWIALLWVQRARRAVGIRNLVIFAACLTLSFFLMLRFVAEPQLRAASWLPEIRMWQDAFPPLAHPWRLPLWLLQVHAGELLAYPIGGKAGASALSLILAIAGGIALARKRPAWTIMLLAPLALNFIAAALHRYPYGGGPRVSLFMAPAFCLLIGRGVASALMVLPAPHLRRIAVGSTLCTLALICVGGIVRDMLKPYHMLSDRENRSLIHRLAKETMPQDAWVSYIGLTDDAPGPNLYAWGGSAARFRYYLELLAPVPIHWSPAPQAIQKPETGRIHLLVYRDNKEPFDQSRLDAYLDRAKRAWGPSAVASTPLGPVERIDVYRYPP